MRSAIIGLLLAVALPASAAQIYKYTDANGNTVFTNQPPEGQHTQAVELQPTNTVESQKPASAPEKPKDEAPTRYTVLQLVNLPTDEALRSNNGTFTVSVALEPRLQPGHSLRLVMDGQPYGQPTNIPYFQVTEADRGEHTLVAEVLGKDGQPLQQSAPATVAIQRISVNSPARNGSP
ncbi:DUF4124 domain-containing protein [Pseudomonas mangiferae]|uniref:DUF4124 domain-containing protein n=1 Tax=Pseudomonas mangiferae TaxID=2593654 RepID=A0A553GYS6_9PSED|nr:DUF4124 domain-containing protein [Pseudomonas mangiferae]TRX74654.1 DUF4124 domain-containing protein [Pseudomonas mangiferae]